MRIGEETTGAISNLWQPFIWDILKAAFATDRETDEEHCHAPCDENKTV